VSAPDQPNAEQQASEVADCFFELIGNIIGQAEQLAQRLAIPAPFIKALHTLERPMAMKELGKRMHCDPSFVTLLADMLEKRGLARREPHPADRRVKNLVLTEDGSALKQRVEAEITARIRKMLRQDDPNADDSPAEADNTLADPAGAAPAGDSISGAMTSLLVATLQDDAAQPSQSLSATGTGR